MEGRNLDDNLEYCLDAAKECADMDNSYIVFEVRPIKRVRQSAIVEDIK